MGATKPPVFQLYRYQILPLRQIQIGLFGEDTTSSLAEIVARKNETFAEALRTISDWKYPKGEINYRFEAEDNSAFVLRMGILRPKILHTREFGENQAEDWPGILIFIDNEADVQKAAIQLDYRVFQLTQTVARILEENLNRVLRSKNLSVFFEPLFERGDFWRTVEEYPNQIVQASFDLISPNMSNITGDIKLDLGALHKTTNTKRTRLELNSQPGSVLSITPSDPTINSLVDYASEGGGEISLKIVGLKRKIKTSKSVKETTIEEVAIQGHDAKQLAEVARRILE